MLKQSNAQVSYFKGGCITRLRRTSKLTVLNVSSDYLNLNPYALIKGNGRPHHRYIYILTAIPDVGISVPTQATVPA